MISVSVSIPLSEEDRAFLQELLDVAPEPVAKASREGKIVLPDGETVEPSDESETDEFQELSKKAFAQAKVLLDTKEPEKVAIVKAALEKIGLERVTHMTTVKQVKAFTKALG